MGMVKAYAWCLLAIACAVFIAGCSQKAADNAVIQNADGEVVVMKLTSPAFQDNGVMPPRFTCNGANVNPELAIEGVPSNAKSLALIVDDPDAPSKVWVHWVVFNIGPKTTRIGENSVPSSATEGTTDFKTQGYGGPCPPSGTHRYMFKLYALDTTLNLGPSATKEDVEAAMQGHVIAQATLAGLYQQKR